MHFKKMFLALLVTGATISLKAVEANNATFTFTHFANEQELNEFLDRVKDSNSRRVYGFNRFPLLYKLAILARNVDETDKPKVVEAFRYLINRNPKDASLTDEYGNTLLHSAINIDKLRYPNLYEDEDLFNEIIVRILLDAEANPNLKNKVTDDHLGYSPKELLEVAFGARKMKDLHALLHKCNPNPWFPDQECSKIRRTLNRMNQQPKK